MTRKIKFYKVISFLVFTTLYPQLSYALQSNFSGTSKVTAFGITGKDFSKANFSYLEFPNRFSIIISNSDENILFETSYQFSLVKNHQDTPLTDLAISGIDYRHKALNPIEKTRNDTTLKQNIDRLQLTLLPPSSSIIIGRQQLTFGSGFFTRPTDIFAPLTIFSISEEERPGVDMIRAKYFIGNNEIDIGKLYTNDQSLDHQAQYLRLAGTLASAESSIIITRTHNNEMIGINYKPELFDTPLWLEVTYTKSEQIELHTTHYHRVSLGMQKIMENNNQYIIEYSYNSLGSTNSNDYILLLANPNYLHSGSFLLGQQHLHLSFQKEITPIIIGSLNLSHNIFDHSNLFRSNLDWNTFENQYLSSTVLFGDGTKKAEFNVKNSAFQISYKLYY